MGGHWYLQTVNLPLPCVVDHTTRISKQQEFCRKQRCHILILFSMELTLPSFRHLPYVKEKRASQGTLYVKPPVKKAVNYYRSV